MSDKDLLAWVYRRFVDRYKENPNQDWLIRLKALAARAATHAEQVNALEAELQTLDSLFADYIRATTAYRQALTAERDALLKEKRNDQAPTEFH